MTKRLLLITLFFISVNLFAQAPVLSNFRVENSEKSRIYFDSSIPITGTNHTGFYLSDGKRKTVSGVRINNGQVTGHYFTLSSSFNFWDTYAIRYEGGSDIQGEGNSPLLPFWLVEVENLLPEPKSSAPNYFVRTTGNDSNDGLSHETAFKTLNKALSIKAKNIFVEAGDYGAESINFSYNGTANEPILLQGYKTITNGIPDEITSNYWTWGDYGTGANAYLDTAEMPTLTGSEALRNTTRGSGTAINMPDYCIVKNFQSTKWNKGFNITSSDHIMLKNIVNLYSGHTSNSVGGSVYVVGGQGQGTDMYNKFINIVAAQGVAIVRLYGGASLFDNVKVYNDGGGKRVSDYFISIYEGSNNIVKNSLVDKTTGSGGSHGIGLKSWDYETEYNLFENCEAINFIGSYELRHDHVKNNVIRNCKAYSRLSDDYSSNGLAGIVVRDNASFNKIENCEIYRIKRAIYFTDQPSEQGKQTPGFNNIFRNILIRDSERAIVTNGSSGMPIPYNNTFYNLTIDNCDRFIDNNAGMYFNSTNKFVNTVVSNCKSGLDESKPSISYSNFYNINFPLPAGQQITTHEPGYISAANDDYHLRQDSKLIDLGQEVEENKFDYDGKNRPQGASHDIGAYEYQSSFTGSVTPSEAEICSGEEVTLVASGGSIYSWNTGETESSITVSPITTTTYTVTIYEGNNSINKDVTITVNEAPSVVASEDVSICFDEEVTLTATGEGDFLWSNGETGPSITVSPTETTTYSVTASNSCATDATDTVTVQVSEQIVLEVSEDMSICAGQSIVLTATSNSPLVWNTGETDSSITVSPTSTTNYTVSSSNGDCSEEKVITVTVSNLPSVITSEDMSICSGEEVELTASGEGDFLWSNGEVGPTIIVSPSETTIYTVTATTLCATEATDTVTVEVSEQVNLQLSDTNITICSGEEITITATSNEPVVWSDGSTDSSITVSPTSTTTYTVTSSNDNCSEEQTVTINVNDLASAVASEDVSICYGEEVILTVEGVGAFTWSTGETESSITVSPTETTTYTVTSTTNCSVDVTDTVTVEVSPPINLEISENVSICSGESITLTATSNLPVTWGDGSTDNNIAVSPTSTTTYTVSSGNGDCTDEKAVTVTVNDAPNVQASEDVFICLGEVVVLQATGEGDFLWSNGESGSTITVSPTSTTTYTVTAATSCSTEATDSVTVEVLEAINLEVSENVSICSGESVTLTSTSNVPVVWSNGSTDSSITVSPTNTTEYVVVASNGNCSVEKRITVLVNTLPNVVASGDKSICFGEEVILVANGVGDFTWSTGETGSSITVSPTSTTVYTVTAATSCATDATDSVTIEVSQPINLEVSEDVTICSGESVTLTSTSNVSVLWSNGSTDSSITVSPTNTTVYRVVASSGNCSKERIIRVTVNSAPSVTVSDDASICSGEEVVLIANGVGNFRWSTGETGSIIRVNPTETTTYTVTAVTSCAADDATDTVTIQVSQPINLEVSENVSICSGESITLTATSNSPVVWSTGSTDSSITVSPNTTTTYTVSSSNENCSEEKTIIVTVNNASSVVASDDVSICSGDEVVLTATGEGDFLWSNGEFGSSITVSPTSTTTYTVTASGSCGDSTDEVEVVVNNKPTVDVGEDVTIEIGTSKTLTASGDGTFKWSNGEEGNSITVSPSSTTTYVVTSTNETGCTEEDEVLVTVVDASIEGNGVIIASMGGNISICLGRRVTLNALEGDSYLWSNGETTSSITVEPEETVIYSVKVTTGDDSVTESIIISVGDACTNANFDSSEEEMIVYPNPTDGLINIEVAGFKSKLLNISVFNLNGVIVYSKSIENNFQSNFLKEQVNLSRFAKGVYFVRIANSNGGRVETKKILVI